MLTEALDRHLRRTPSLFLVLNPNAGRVQKSMGDDPGAPAPALSSRLHLTTSLDELTELFASLPVNRGQTVCFYGGDGSIARGMSAMINSLGEDAPLPTILPVRAGTINVLSGNLGLSEDPELTLARLHEPGRLQRRALPSLKIVVEGERPVYGFMFAWGVGYRVLESYYARAPQPSVGDAALVMAQTFGQSLHPRATELPLFACHDLQLSVDAGAPASLPLHSLIVGTLEQTTMGFRPLPADPVAPQRFHYSGNGMHPAQVFRHAFPLLFARGDQRELAGSHALVAGANISQLSFELSGGYTLDGEMIAIEGPRTCTISAGPRIEFWAAGEA